MVRLLFNGRYIVLNKGEVSCSDEIVRIHAQGVLQLVKAQKKTGPSDGDPDYVWAEMFQEYGYEVVEFTLESQPSPSAIN
ncbi:hypothetical protein Dret_2509 (plasmid) [Desulfohalobium retbaense DSM 5692]|uniref:Uncharacterized protein n=1 Tax=Desulfohalobium retbaense (strain ATCC 49708 / DSM 5692 / JCM 16813 / HR100) TaxID=485915 RepID=C8X5U2_DESRD|nr:hypothetical protein Dret_2509 [Desulfohalobium retbaense DSM 5692]